MISAWALSTAAIAPAANRHRKTRSRRDIDVFAAVRISPGGGDGAHDTTMLSSGATARCFQKPQRSYIYHFSVMRPRLPCQNECGMDECHCQESPAGSGD